MDFERVGTQPYDRQPNKAELEAQREKYIAQAIESVLMKNKKEVLRHPARHFVTMVQNELLVQSGMDKQQSSRPEDLDAAIDEFPQSVIAEKIFDFFGVENGDYGVLEEKLKRF